MEVVGHIQTLLLLNALLCPEPVWTQSDLNVFVEENGRAVLPCGAVLPGQRQCRRTTWVYRDLNSFIPEQETTLDVRSGYSRFSLTGDCSLVIGHVQMGDSGVYSCKQLDRSRLEVFEESVLLSVVRVTERVHQDDVALSCSVMSPVRCEFLQMKWLRRNVALTSDPPFSINAFSCGATLYFPLRVYRNRDQFSCEIYDGNSEHQFKVNLAPAALTSPASDVFLEAERDVVLTCDKLQDSQRRCERTTWIYSDPTGLTPTREIVSLGETNPDSGNEQGKFSLTERCSLVVRRVGKYDAGLYSCVQYDRRGRRVSDAPSIRLSVVTLTEDFPGPMEWSCSVSSPLNCSDLQVKWLHRDADRTAVTKEILYPCGAILIFPDLSDAPRGRPFVCEVTHSNKKHEFQLRSEKKGVNQTEGTTAAPPGGHSGEFTGWWFLVLKAVCWSALISAAAIVSICTRERKKPDQSDGATAVTRRENPRNLAPRADYMNQR